VEELPEGDVGSLTGGPFSKYSRGKMGFRTNWEEDKGIAKAAFT